MDTARAIDPPVVRPRQFFRGRIARFADDLFQDLDVHR
jgi:hypothetical protein